MTISKIITKLKCYKPADYRSFICCRILRTYRQKFHFMTQTVDRIRVESLMRDFDLDARELTYDDFAKGFSEMQSPGKLQIHKDRLESGDYRAYGVFDNGNLIYAYWLSFSKLGLPVASQMILDHDEVLMEDAYCLPEYRSKGIHYKMTNYLLYKILETGRSKASTIVLDGNIPAWKVYVKAGFINERTFYIYRVLGIPYVGLKRKTTCR